MLKDYDLIARWGGDEFLVILLARESSEVLEVVERLSVNFSLTYRDIDITLSVGYACFPYDGNTLDKLIEVVDNRMYRAKALYKEANRYALEDTREEKV